MNHISNEQSTLRIRKDEISPRVASGANNSDGAANHADLCSNVLSSDTQKTQEVCHRGLLRRLNAVAALQRTGVALIGRRAASSDKGGERESGEGGEDGELHI